MVEIISDGRRIIKNAMQDIKITAHRGYSKVAPENTIPAIEEAIEAMSDYVEIDIQQTSDGVVILLHDDNLKRTTGVNQKIGMTSYDEVVLLDAGYYKGEEYAGTVIPTLREALEYGKDKISFNIEIKYNRYNTDIVEQTISIIEELEMEAQCVVTSSYKAYLEEVKQINEDIVTGLIISAIAGNDFEDECLDFYSINANILSSNVVNLIHRAGKEVHVWTVDKKKDLERMKQYNVDNIITNDPILTREIVYKNEVTESLWELIRLALQ